MSSIHILNLRSLCEKVQLCICHNLLLQQFRHNENISQSLLGCLHGTQPVCLFWKCVHHFISRTIHPTVFTVASFCGCRVRSSGLTGLSSPVPVTGFSSSPEPIMVLAQDLALGPPSLPSSSPPCWPHRGCGFQDTEPS